MIVAISQPTFLPWLGYFNLIAAADVFVFLDTVQFERQSWQSRNRLRTAKGDIQWLAVPVSKQPLATLVRDVAIAPNPPVWRRKMSGTIATCLGKAPFFKEAKSLADNILGDDSTFDKLADMNIRFIGDILRDFNITTRLVRSSDLPVAGHRSDLLVDICRHLGATTYYSNAGSSAYLEESRPIFREAGVSIIYQGWNHPLYKQTGPGFVSHLSCLDAIACMGTDAAAASVRTGMPPSASHIVG
jgi:hypothetical protein